MRHYLFFCLFLLLKMPLVWAECSVNIDITQPNCNNERGRIRLIVEGGTPPFVYEWSENAGIKSQPTANNLSSGIYTITISDSDACEQIVVAELIEPANFSITAEAILPTCHELLGGLSINAIGRDTSNQFTYSINNLGYQFESTFLNLSPGDYTVYAKDQNACIKSTSVTIPTVPPLEIELGYDYIMTIGDSIEMDAYNYDERFVDFEWIPTEGLSCSDCPQPTVKINDTQVYTLIVTDSVGCTASDEVSVLVQKNRNIYIPDAFSPDLNGINDFFVIYSGQGVLNLRDLQIYDRWGNIVYEVKGDFLANDYRIAWNGNYGADKAPIGDYIYRFTAIFADNAAIAYQGSIKLVR